MNRIAIIGCTGSVGRQALDVIDLHPGEFEVVALTAKSSREELLEAAYKYRPKYVGIVDEAASKGMQTLLPEGVKLGVGDESLVDAATLAEADTVLISTVGFSGFSPLMAAIESGKRIALANKESIVCGGSVVMEALRKKGQHIYPVDSEHSCLFQLIQALKDPSELKRIILTASGGPFRTTDKALLDNITPAQAVAHPSWSMGQKISVDSATLMNKGFEVIEAHWLFSVAASEIEVLIHPESIVHSLIELTDNTQLAQLSKPDMRLAIQYALSYPRRMRSSTERLDLTKISKLHFEAPRMNAFPCLELAYRALEENGIMPVVLNAADEIAVERFLKGRISFMEIPIIIERALDKAHNVSHPTLDDIYQADAWTREMLRFSEKSA